MVAVHTRGLAYAPHGVRVSIQHTFASAAMSAPYPAHFPRGGLQGDTGRALSTRDHVMGPGGFRGPGVYNRSQELGT